jgi:hypothetical protein
MYDIYDNKYVIESATTQTIENKEDIELYEELTLALELINDDKFNLVNSEINNGIVFGISTPYPYGLPVDVGTIFYNMNMNYNVKIKETSKYVYNVERYFEIKIEKN